MTLFFQLFTAICLLLSFSACQQKERGHLPSFVEITVFHVEPTTIPAEMEFVGVAESSHLVEIRARVEGYLDRIAYEEGGLVKEGKLLFQIDPIPFQAKLEMASAELDKQKARVWQTKKSVERFQPLYEQKAASQRDLDNAIASNLAAEADQEGARANLFQAELNLGYTSISSPITGLSSQSKYREGTLITPGENGLLTTIQVIDPIWVNFNVSENDILKSRTDVKKKRLVLPPDMKFTVEVILSDGSKFPQVGQVDFADPGLNRGTGTMFVRSTFANPHGVIKPGQFVRAVLKGATRPDATIVPQTSVQQGRKGMFVYVVDKNNKASPRNVEVGPWFGHYYWIILSGIEQGDKVIVDGVNKVQEGTEVKIAKEFSYTPGSEENASGSG